MAFDGDLESLPITDLIQLLHATGKSGTLTLRGPKGESQLVFDAGNIASANHVNNSMRIGRILVDLGALSHEELESALRKQAGAGQRRAPLVATLLEEGKLLPAQAHKGLEILIELTIVEVLTWSEGTFSFDVTRTFVSDEYRYFPENLEQRIVLNTQSVLMDALRIYDERKRDGTLMEATFFAAEEPEPESVLSPEDLGLDALDDLERTPPEPFHGLADQDSPGSVRQLLKGVLPPLPPEEEERLVRYLERVAQHPPGAEGLGILLLSAHPLTAALARCACGERLLAVAATAEDLAPLLEEGAPARRVLLVGTDAALAEGEGAKGPLPSLCRRFPTVDIYLLMEGGHHELFARALQEGVKGVLPWPGGGSADRLAAESIDSCEALRHLLGSVQPPATDPVPPHFLKLYRELPQLGTPAEITLSLLRFVSGILPRAVTLVQLRGELVAEKGIGFRSPGAVSALNLRVPLGAPSLLREVTEGGELYYGEADPFTREAFAALGAPASRVLLLPVRSMGRVAAVIYADWGEEGDAPLPLSLLAIMAQHAGLVLDNALYRKRVAQGAPPRGA